jgi:hypothetical protein
MNFDFESTRQFLNALNKPPGTLRLRAFLPSGHPLKGDDKGRKGPPSKEDIIRWQQEGRGIYAVINDGGDTDKEITHCRAFFCEWDDRPKGWQITASRSIPAASPSTTTGYSPPRSPQRTGPSSRSACSSTPTPIAP